MFDKEKAREEVKFLIEKYNKLVESGKLKSYNEEMTKKDFILPLFRALGWAVEDGEEVTAEEKISRGRVDYAFRIEGIPKLFLEAKALKVDLDKIEFAEQAINYAWHKGATWAILTDFEGIKVFNAEWKTKNPLQNMFFSISHNQFLERFEQLLLLSRESLEQGLLSKEAEKWGKKAKKIPVDKQLLNDLTNFRELLTKNILKLNYSKDLSEEELEEAVQRILDRLIFIRTLEDKQLEPPILQTLIRADTHKRIYKKLNALFREIDDIYNSKLFTEHLCEELIVDDDILEKIIRGLFKTSDNTVHYDFGAIDADVLGNMYEQYLGHILKKTDKRAKFSSESAHRKEQGIYYTPTYVVDYIVRNTVGELAKNKKFDLENIKILDPACGSGSFLMKAFDYLVTLSKQKNGDIDQTKLDLTGVSATYGKKVEILKNNIFGVDLDPKAVEIAQLNLLLKAAEKKQRLPTLQENVKVGDSLVDDQKVIKEKAFKWNEEFEPIMESGGFDVIIGNPPYVFTRERNFGAGAKEFFKENYSNRIELESKSKAKQSGKLNLFALFLIRGIDLLKEEGLLSFIIPNTFLRVNTYIKLRKFILNHCKILNIADAGTGVFEGVTASTVIVVLQKESEEKKRKNNKINVSKLSAHDENGDVHQIVQEDFMNNENYVFNIISNKKFSDITSKIERKTKPLGEIGRSFNGIATKKDKSKYISHYPKNSKYKPLLEGKDIKRYRVEFKNKFIVYDRELLHRPRDEKIFLNNEKIITQRIGGGADVIIATLDNEQYYTFNSTNNIILHNNKFSSKYILGLLNSKLLNWYYVIQFTNMSTLTVNISKTNLEQLPIKDISIEEQKPIIDFVDELLELNKEYLTLMNKSTDKKKQIEMKIKKLEEQLNNFIFKLYGISSKEIKIIEESMK